MIKHHPVKESNAATTWRGLPLIHPKNNPLGYGLSSG